jgi:hypothetical protein
LQQPYANFIIAPQRSLDARATTQCMIIIFPASDIALDVNDGVRKA